MNTTCYQQLDWPQIPEPIIISLLENTKNKIEYLKKINSIASTGYFQVPATEELVNWVQQNLPVDNDHVVAVQVFNNVENAKMHKDLTRDIAYNYLLVPHTATTRWFDDHVNLIDQVQYQYGFWYKHSADIFHDVIDINGFRAAVTVYPPKY